MMTEEKVSAKRTPTPRNLSLVQSMQLCNLINAEYTTSGLTDSEFAKYASQKLGFEAIYAHVVNRRNALEIPIRRSSTKKEKAPENELEIRVAYLFHELGISDTTQRFAEFRQNFIQNTGGTNGADDS